MRRAAPPSDEPQPQPPDFVAVSNQADAQRAIEAALLQSFESDTNRCYVGFFRVSADTPQDGRRMRTAAVEIMSQLNDRAGCVCTHNYVQDRWHHLLSISCNSAVPRMLAFTGAVCTGIAISAVASFVWPAGL